MQLWMFFSEEYARKDCPLNSVDAALSVNSGLLRLKYKPLDTSKTKKQSKKQDSPKEHKQKTNPQNTQTLKKTVLHAMHWIPLCSKENGSMTLKQFNIKFTWSLFISNDKSKIRLKGKKKKNTYKFITVSKECFE